jgi:hypothetical protein
MMCIRSLACCAALALFARTAFAWDDPMPPAADDAVPPAEQIEISDEPRGIDPAQFVPAELAQPATVDLTNSSIAELAEWVGMQTGLRVLIDQPRLEEMGYTEGEPISDRLDNEPVYLLLNRLKSLDLGWTINDGVITISTEDYIADLYTTRSYTLTTLLDAEYDEQQLIDTIHESTSGEWVDLDGIGGELQLLGDVLFVRQTAAVQREVEGLLLAIQQPARRTFILDSPQNQRIRDRLRETVSVDFEDTPLSEAMETLTQATGISIRLDQRSLRDGGIRVREPLTLSLEDRQLDTVLAAAFHNLRLTWNIEDGVLWITTQSTAADRLKAAVYDVRDLCRDFGESNGLMDAILGATSGEWGDIDGIGGAISFPKPGTMVVRQTEQVHHELLTLLENYRTALRNSRPREREELDPNEVLTRYYRMDKFQATDLLLQLPQIVRPGSWNGDAGESPGKVNLVAASETHAVLIVVHTRSAQEEIATLLQKLETGDSIQPPAGMQGGGGGFGGGFFSID